MGNCMANKVEYIGAEDEFRFISDRPDYGGELNKKFMEKLENAKPTFGNGASKYSRMWKAYNSFYIDKNVSESNTRLVKLGKGCAKELVGEMLRGRAYVAEYGEGPANLVSTHYNIGFENTQHKLKIADLAMDALEPVYKVLLRNSNKRIRDGKWKFRIQDQRIEFCTRGGFDRTQLEAGVAFLIGTLKGMERLLDEEASGDPEKAYSKLPVHLPSFQRWRESRDMDILEKGLDAVVETDKGSMKVVEVLGQYLKLFEKDIEKFATADEMATLRGYVTGRNRLEEPLKDCCIDRGYISNIAGKSPNELINEDSELEGAPKLFRDAVLFADGKEIAGGNGKRKTESIGWNAISFGIHDRSTGDNYKITVPREQMEEYLALEASVGAPETLLGEAKTRGWLTSRES